MNTTKLAQQDKYSILSTIVNDRIRAAMNEKGLSVAELAADAEMSLSTLRRRLSGKGQPFSVSELAFLAVSLDKDLAWISGADLADQINAS